MLKNIFLFFVFTALCVAGNKISPNYLIELSSMGIPAHNREEAAWRINDLFVYNNRLYIGTGDAVVNTGPTKIIFYDLAGENFTEEFQIDEEAIYRFEEINGRLMIPGTDATEDWTFGNIYIHTDSGWVKYRTLPRALHVMDLVWYRDMICASTVTETSISESVQSYHGAIYTSSDTARNWELLYITPGDGNTVFHMDAMTEFKGDLYAFVYAHCGLKESDIPEEFQSSLGEKYEGHYQVINHDVFGTNDALCFDGNRWQYKDIIPGNELARIVRPITFKDNLILPIIRGKYIDYLKSRDSLPAQARTEIFVYSGGKPRKMKIKPEMIISTRVINDTLFVLFKQDIYYFAVTNDLREITFYQLPTMIGTPRAFDYYSGVFYIGNSEGNIYKSIARISIKKIHQESACVPIKCLGIMPDDAIIESGWITMYERINTDTKADITAEVLNNNAIRIKTNNLKQFKVFLPEFYLNLNRHVILLIDRDIIFDGRLYLDDELMCRRADNGKWHAEILRKEH